MAYKVALDAARGGLDIGSTNNGIIEKDYNLNISKYIKDRLDDFGIDNFLVRDDDVNLTDEQRVNIIKNKYGTKNNIIVISNRLNTGGNKGAEIMYALRNNSKLASLISSNLENIGQNVNKYYQLRDSNNTYLDDDYIIRNTKNNQSIVINYGYIDNENDAIFLKENMEKLGEAVVKAILDYANITYIPNDLTGYYVVKKGDSLWSIASKNNTTVDNIKRLNNLTNNNLQVGQVLKITSDSDEIIDDSMTKNLYTVQSGDNLYSIARKYNTTVDNIKRLNNLSSNNLSIGQVLILPNESDIDEGDTNKITYIVKKGDSLWSIANKYDTTVDKIKEINNLSSSNLSIGQSLVIFSTSNYITYTVKKGDSLWSIANKYNTTVNNIKKLNSLTNNNLSVGQKLIIPN